MTVNIKSLSKKDQNVKITGFKKGMSLLAVNTKLSQQISKKGNISNALE